MLASFTAAFEWKSALCSFSMPTEQFLNCDFVCLLSICLFCILETACLVSIYILILYA